MATAVTKPGYREFTATKVDGSKLKLSVRLPNARELQTADLEASGAFNRALESALPTRQRLIRRLKANGLWSEEDSNRLELAREALGKAEQAVRDLDKTGTDEQKKEADKDLKAAQTELGSIRSDFESMLAHTADARADEARRNFLIACTIEHAEDGEGFKKAQRLWSTGVAEFLNEKDTLLSQRAVYEYLACENDMPSEWTQAEIKAEQEAAEAQAKLDAEAKAKADAESTQAADPLATAAAA